MVDPIPMERPMPKVDPIHKSVISNVYGLRNCFPRRFIEQVSLV